MALAERHRVWGWGFVFGIMVGGAAVMLLAYI